MFMNKPVNVSANSTLDKDKDNLRSYECVIAYNFILINHLVKGKENDKIIYLNTYICIF